MADEQLGDLELLNQADEAEQETDLSETAEGEESTEETGRALWRGHITHIPDGTRRYVQDLDSIVFFLFPYLARMGVKLGLHCRLKRWVSKSV